MTGSDVAQDNRRQLSTTMVVPTPQRLDGTYAAMDAARAVAACIVVVSHARDLALVDATPGMGTGRRLFYAATGFGHEAVMIFFVLSGYWIVRSVVGKATATGPFWRPYLVDRLSRLWVVLVPALVLGGLFDALGIGLRLPVYPGLTGAHSIPPGGIVLRAGDLAGNLFFLQTLIVPTFGSNGPLWSLAYEFWFYIWFPALWLAIRFRRPTLPLAGLVLMWLYPAVTMGFAAWLVGGVAFAIHRRLAARGDRPRIGAVLLLTGLIAMAAALLASRARIAGPFADLALATAFGSALLGALLRPLPQVPRLAAVARYGANASFSLYAIHFPLLALLIGLIGRRLPPNPGSMALVMGLTAIAVVAGGLFAASIEARTPAIRARLREGLAPPAR